LAVDLSWQTFHKDINLLHRDDRTGAADWMTEIWEHRCAATERRTQGPDPQASLPATFWHSFTNIGDIRNATCQSADGAQSETESTIAYAS